MDQTVIIADDLTGANVTGALLKSKGYRVATFLPEVDENRNLDFDAIAISTDSRHILPDQARETVMDIARRHMPQGKGFYQKRIDSTLRGNIGAEIDALLSLSPKETVAFLCPAYPQVGKIVVGGNMLVNGTLLHQTDVAKDPKSPVTKSAVKSIVEEKSGNKVFWIDRNVFTHETIEEKVCESLAAGYRIIGFDAMDNRDLKAIAEIIVKLDRPFITVDPGPLTLEIMQKIKPKQKRKKTFFAVGSVHKIVRQQIISLETEHEADIRLMNVRSILDKPEQEIERLLKELDQCNCGYLGIVGTRTEEDILDLAAESAKTGRSIENISEDINSAIAEVTQRYIRAHSDDVGAVFSCGGDITLAICRSLGAIGMEVMDEVEPFTMYGSLIGGEFDGLPIVTKGGLAGKKDTLSIVADFLEHK